MPVDYLGKRSRIDAARLARLLALRLDDERPQAAIGFMTYSNLLLLAADRLARHRARIIATEHVDPAAMVTLPKRAQLRAAAWLYPRASAVVAVSDGMRSALVRRLRLNPAQVVTIYNPFDPDIDAVVNENTLPHEWFGSGQPVLVAVGRLVPQKGYDVLLDALARIRHRLPAKLLVLGDGEQLSALVAQAQDLNIGGAVQFIGFQPNPFRFMSAADVYVMPSRWEGFPLALVEACRCGAAIVATDCPYGPSEIIEPERSGLLVPPEDPAALADAIVRVISDPALRNRLSAGARDRSESFTPDVAVRRYEALVEAPGAIASTR